MRHKKSGRKLGRNPSHRKALLRNLAKALLIHGRITTTLAKAKDLRGVVEPLVTLALKNDLHARREAYRFLGEHKLVSRLFGEIGPVFAGGGGGYTRVVKLAVPRRGDAAPLAIIEFVRKPGETPPAAKAVSAEQPEKNPLPAPAALPVAETPPALPESGETPPVSAEEKEPG
jgi:large subunit ribosomal protein L17